MRPRLLRAFFLTAVAVPVAYSFSQDGKLAGDQDGKAGTAVLDRDAILEAIGGDKTVDAAISAEEIREHVKALSHDDLKGRLQGSPESLIAAAYCAERLKSAGFVSGAGDDSFMQRIRYERAVFDAPSELHLYTGGDEPAETLLNQQSFSFTQRGVPADTGKLTCVYVDDEEAVPEPDSSVALVMLTSAGKARRWIKAAGHGDGAGFGMIIVPKKLRKKDETGEREPRKQKDSRNGVAREGRDRLSVSVFTEEAAEVFEARQVTSVSFVAHATKEESVDANVVALLRGASAPEEFVLLVAHRDHIGLRRVPADAVEEGQDLINNGADDDASGCAVVMEVAEALAQAGERPARSVVVVLVTGEESGFVGSRYYAAHPTVPLESIVCALNFEMLGRPDDLVGGSGKVWMTGDQRSSLGPGLRERKIDVAGDPRPGDQFFGRSDNVSFAEVGVVSQTLSSYNMHKDYHRVTDEWQTLDYDHMEAAAQVALAAVRSLCTGEWTPAWKPGEPKL